MQTTIRPGDVGHDVGDVAIRWGYQSSVEDDGSNFEEWAACDDCGGFVEYDDVCATHV